MERSYVLTASCPDRTGITAAVTGFIGQHDGWISEAAQHSDPLERTFFMRIEILADSLPFGPEGFRERFAETARRLEMQWQLSDSACNKRVVILVSRQDHCLNELLYRWRTRDCGFDIACVISNHEDLRGYVEWHGIPYFYVPVSPQTKATAFDRIRALYEEHRGDVMVLARYMQILPPEICVLLRGRIINIHHSFLPSFAGARPYHQAADRGVKLVGATCHYVTEQLDAGPIIEQDVVRINHADSVEDMVRLGRDIEKLVLARGLRYHVQDRVLLHRHKTIVFD
jgi:formyltetrahydrofolate deformylase